jgi:hypothetical protein
LLSSEVNGIGHAEAGAAVAASNAAATNIGEQT